jgi:hypothetical protein
MVSTRSQTRRLAHARKYRRYLQKTLNKDFAWAQQQLCKSWRLYKNSTRTVEALGIAILDNIDEPFWPNDPDDLTREEFDAVCRRAWYGNVYWTMAMRSDTCDKRYDIIHDHWEDVEVCQDRLSILRRSTIVREVLGKCDAFDKSMKCPF